MLYNKYGVRVYTQQEFLKVLDKEIISKRKAKKDIKQKGVDYNYWQDWYSGFIEALEWVRKELNRENWQPGREIEESDLLKVKIHEYINQNVIPELDKEDFDVIMIFKEFLNSNFEY